MRRLLVHARCRLALPCRTCSIETEADSFQGALTSLDSSWDPGPVQHLVVSGAADGSVAAWQLPALHLLSHLSLHLGAVSLPAASAH